MELKDGSDLPSPQPSFKPPLSTPTERGTDEDKMQIDFGDLHSTPADYFYGKTKQTKSLTFLFSSIPSTIPGTKNQAFQSEFAFKAHKSKNELIDKS